MGYLINIDRLSGTSNLGGILSIQVARKEDLVSIPEPVGSIIYGDIVFKPGRGWVVWHVTNETPSADSDTRPSREGPSKSNRLNFSVPKYNAGIHAMFERASDDELIVLYKDANGKLKIFGLLGAPVRFSYSHNSGAAHVERNSFTGQFYYDGPENMYQYNGQVSSAPPGPAPAIVMVNGEVVASLQPGETINFDTDFDFDFAIIGS